MSIPKFGVVGVSHQHSAQTMMEISNIMWISMTMIIDYEDVISDDRWWKINEHCNIMMTMKTPVANTRLLKETE